MSQQKNKSLGITSTCEQISGSPINFSKTKQLWSFSKAPRFGDTKNSNCNKHFYYLPPATERRTTSFGYGRKFDFTKNLVINNPAPNAYPQTYGSLTERASKKGFTFGLARELLKSQGIFQFKKNQPGPGNYDLKSTLNKVSFTMRPKTQNPQDNTTDKRSPGPGNYNIIECINKKGQFPISKYKALGTGVFNPLSSQRFGSISKDLIAFPSPDHYKPSGQITPEGYYFPSKFNSSRCRTFSRQKREYYNLKDGKPGPGTYRAPSEFGYYEMINDKENQQGAAEQNKSSL